MQNRHIRMLKNASKLIALIYSYTSHRGNGRGIFYSISHASTMNYLFYADKIFGVGTVKAIKEKLNDNK